MFQTVSYFVEGQPYFFSLYRGNWLFNFIFHESWALLPDIARQSWVLFSSEHDDEDLVSSVGVPISGCKQFDFQQIFYSEPFIFRLVKTVPSPIGSSSGRSKRYFRSADQVSNQPRDRATSLIVLLFLILFSRHNNAKSDVGSSIVGNVSEERSTGRGQAN